MTEQWRPVVGYEGYYEVSNLGNVRGVDRQYLSKDGRRLHYKSRLLKQKLQHYYWRTSLTRQSITTVWCVHRLVCEAFHGIKPSPTAVVRHLNGEHTDNRAENLFWGTCAENTADMLRHGRAYWAKQTQCIRGHEFTAENTRVVITRSGQQRNCRSCERIRAVPKNQKRSQLKREQWKSRPCRACGTNFQHPQSNAVFCSPECKKASRRVDFKRGRLAA